MDRPVSPNLWLSPRYEGEVCHCLDLVLVLAAAVTPAKQASHKTHSTAMSTSGPNERSGQ